MKKLILATSIALALSVSLAPAAQASTEEDRRNAEQKNEAVGFGAGALTGAAVGGPFGAVIGGIVGLFIADDVNDENRKDEQAQALIAKDAMLKKQNQDIAMLRSDIDKITQEQLTQLVNFEQSKIELLASSMPNIETNVQFKTASSAIDDSYKAQLNSIADLLNQFPELSVKITGFADQRGDEQANIELSTQRAEAVKDYLSEQQVNINQIHYSGLGEQNNRDLQKESLEKLFFDRKATIQILPSSAVMTAAN